MLFKLSHSTTSFEMQTGICLSGYLEKLFITKAGNLFLQLQ